LSYYRAIREFAFQQEIKIYMNISDFKALDSGYIAYINPVTTA
jgi:hypothetical protein